MTERFELQVEDCPTAEDIAALDGKLAAFTAAASGHRPPEPLAVFARHDGTVAAGVHGWTWGGCCELVSLWVNEPRRRRGLGRAVLATAEEAARRRGCRQVVLFTHAFQAPQLYTMAGYEVVGRVDDYPLGSAAFWFRKRLGWRQPVRVTRLMHSTLYALIAILFVIELVDGIRALRRRAAQRLGNSYTRLESRERRRARRAEIAALAGHLGRRTDAFWGRRRST